MAETYQRVPMQAVKRIALIAHDNCKQDLLDWVRFNRDASRDIGWSPRARPVG